MPRRPMYRVISLAAAVAICGVAYAESPIVPKGEPQQAMAAPAAANAANLPKIDAVLDALHDRGVSLRSFTADVTMTDANPNFGDSSTRAGDVQYKVKADGSPRLYVLFDTRHFAKKPPVKDKKEYLLEDGWLTDRSYGDNNETRRQFVRPGQKVNLFDLATGPFPLPIGQEKAAVYNAFQVTQPPPEPGVVGPPNTAHLLLKPKTNAPLAQVEEQVNPGTAQRCEEASQVAPVDADGVQVAQTYDGNAIPGVRAVFRSVAGPRRVEPSSPSRR